jgi:hypothetical protein
LALGVAARRMSERAFLAAMRRLNSEEARLVEDARPSVGIDPAKAMDYIRNFASSWVNRSRRPGRS